MLISLYDVNVVQLDGGTLREVLYGSTVARIMVGRGGLEPPTSRLSGARSNHLSYRPDSVTDNLHSNCGLVEPNGIEPLTS